MAAGARLGSAARKLPDRRRDPEPDRRREHKGDQHPLRRPGGARLGRWKGRHRHGSVKLRRRVSRCGAICLAAPRRGAGRRHRIRMVPARASLAMPGGRGASSIRVRFAQPGGAFPNPCPVPRQSPDGSRPFREPRATIPPQPRRIPALPVRDKRIEPPVVRVARAAGGDGNDMVAPTRSGRSREGSGSQCSAATRARACGPE